ncbi:Trp biosynthesis-associated membrane protein [Thermobifida halotolerans]|uniref:Trp biosynthesis-associated membrane protein n=1 Tax=Thermobifida halotolerans TaxID=483545 RepID=A0AA97LYL3_9ACTN|nr:Trp biosynthesis-associated membrane protein [Thermobifida halotolerans]UOE20278.1 Trp biosynthesis-associated membrane protein [Thermobifida halotolerans]
MRTGHVAAPARPRRREYLLALALTASGAVALLAVSAQVWASARVDLAGDLAPVAVELSASEVVPAVSALGWAALAALAALVATGGAARRLVGLLVALLGGGALLAVALGVRSAALADAAARAATAEGAVGGVTVAWAWPVLAAAGAALLLAAGVLTLVRGTVWPAMSSRYDRHSAPRATRTDTPAELWRSLDSGADPTDENAEPKER